MGKEDAPGASPALTLAYAPNLFLNFLTSRFPFCNCRKFHSLMVKSNEVMALVHYHANVIHCITN